MIREDLIFERTLKFGFKNKFYIGLVIILEYYSIFMESLISMNKILSSDIKLEKFEGFIEYANYINPYFLVKMWIGYGETKGISEVLFYILFCISFFFFLTFFANCKYQEAKEKEFDFGINEKTLFYKFSDLMNYIFINYFECYFHVFGISSLFLIINVVGGCFNKFFNSSLEINRLSIILQLILAIIFLIYFLILYFKIKNTINVMLQFNSNLSHHNDSLFGRTYNVFLLYLKILIALENNLAILVENRNSYQIIFLNIIIIMSIWFFVIVNMINVLSGNLIFLSNIHWNLLRIFLITLNGIFLIVFGIFKEEMKDFLMFSLTFNAIIFISYVVSKYVGKLVEEKLVLHTSLIYQVIYILNLKQIVNSLDLHREISKIFLNHKLICQISNEIENMRKEGINLGYKNEIDIKCSICNLKEYTYTNFLEVYLKQIKLVMKYNFENFSKNELEYLILLKLIILEQIQKDKVVKLIYKTKAAIDLAAKNKSLLYWNLIIFNRYIRSLTPDDIVKKFLIMKKYDETNNYVVKTLDLIEELYLIYDKHIDKEIYEVSQKINNHKKMIHQNVQMFVKMKNFYIENYTLIIIKYIYENFYNSSLKELNVSNDMGDLEELMSHHFENDNKIKISYNIDYDSLFILKSSKELLHYKNNKLETMFPKIFQKEGKQNFIRMVKDNNSEKFWFDYIIQKKVEEPFINYFKMECLVSLSLDLKELLIIGDYKISNEDIIIFEQDINGKETLLSFSKNLNKILLIPSQYLLTIKNSKSNFFFDDMFQKISYSQKKNFELEYILNEKKDVLNFYKIDYVNYYENYIRIMDQIALRDEEDSFNTDNQQFLIDLKSLAKFKNSVNLSLAKKQQIKKSDRTFIIYSVKKIDLNKLFSESNNMGQFINQIENFEYDDYLTMDGSNSFQGSRTSISTTQARIYNDKFNNNETKNLKELNQITLATSILSFLFIVYCIVFLSLGLKNKNNFTDSFLVRNSFNDLKINFYDTFSSLLTNFKLYENESTNISKNSNSFFQKLKDDTNVSIDYQLFTKDEILIKLEILQSYLSRFQLALVSSAFKEKLDSIFSENIEYYRISLVSNNISLIKNMNSFFDNLKMFVNKAQIIANDENYFVYLYIITQQDGSVDFSNIFDKNLSTNQIFAYEIILNYFNLYKNFEKRDIILNQLHTSRIDQIFNESFYLTFILMGLHLALIFLCFCILRYLNRILKRNKIIVNNLFTNNSVKFMKSKFILFRNLNELYKENPTKLIDKYRRASTTFLQSENKLNLNSSREEKLDIIELKFTKNANYNIDEKTLIKPIFILISILFFFYYSFNFVFYFILDNSKSELSFSSNESEKNVEIYISLLNNLNLLQVMILTNTTDNKLNKIIKGSEDEGYVYNNNDKVLKESFEMYSQNIISERFGILQDYQTKLSNCSYIFNNLNDSIHNQLENLEDFKNYDIKLSLTSICNKYHIMKSDNIKFITSEINFITKDLLVRYLFANSDYKQMKIIYEDYSMFDIYIILTVIMRPIQNYIDNNLNKVSVSMSENYYLTITVIYLIFNILIDLVIFFIIDKRVIKQVLDVNDDLSSFINLIKK